jgi:hypothetical protein
MYSPDIYWPGGKVFVRGIKNSSMCSLFSYNLTDNAGLNRDRNIYDEALKEKEITKLLSKTTSEKVIKQYLTAWRDPAKRQPEPYEYKLNIRPQSSKWRDMAAKILEQISHCRYIRPEIPRATSRPSLPDTSL